MHDARTRRCVPNARQRVLRKADGWRRLAAENATRVGRDAAKRRRRRRAEVGSWRCGVSLNARRARSLWLTGRVARFFNVGAYFMRNACSGICATRRSADQERGACIVRRAAAFALPKYSSVRNMRPQQSAYSPASASKRAAQPVRERRRRGACRHRSNTDQQVQRGRRHRHPRERVQTRFTATGGSPSISP